MFHNTYLERISFIMTIFNNIKRGATDAATKAAKKTGEITNIAKLAMNIKRQLLFLFLCGIFFFKFA